MFQQVTVYHTEHPGIADPAYPVSPVFVYVATIPADADVADECETAFVMFNADLEIQSGQHLVTARQYRALRLRSLSVGDIVQVGRRHFLLTNFAGWQEIHRTTVVIIPNSAQDLTWSIDAPEGR